MSEGAKCEYYCERLNLEPMGSDNEYRRRAAIMNFARWLSICALLSCSWGCDGDGSGNGFSLGDNNGDVIIGPGFGGPTYKETWTKSAESPAPLLGIWGSSANDVWAVGSKNTVLHWNGATWSVALSGTSGELRAVWGSGPTDIWAVGSVGDVSTKGQILHWDGTAWTKSVADAPCIFEAVWGSSNSDVWAVGATASDGCLYRWNGTSWTEQPPLPAAPLKGLWGNTANDIWAVGGKASLNGTIAHWDGVAWSKAVEGSEFVALYGLESIWGSGASDVWAVGSDNVAHWDGQQWSLEQCTGIASLLATGSTPSTCPEGNTDVWGSSANDVWSVGARYVISGFAKHWDGSSWKMTDPNLDIIAYGVWSSGPNDLWVVGTNTGSDGAILHHDE